MKDVELNQPVNNGYMRRHGQTFKVNRSKNNDEMQIIIEEIEKSRVDKNLSRLSSGIDSMGL